MESTIITSLNLNAAVEKYTFDLGSWNYTITPKKGQIK